MNRVGVVLAVEVAPDRDRKGDFLGQRLPRNVSCGGTGPAVVEYSATAEATASTPTGHSFAGHFGTMMCGFMIHRRLALSCFNEFGP